MNDRADAVFLDLPHPWDAVPHAKRAMKKTGAARICSFSPCIEQVHTTREKSPVYAYGITSLLSYLQVQRACQALRKEGFNEIATVECLQREFQVRRITVPVYDADRRQQTKEEAVATTAAEPQEGEEEQNPAESMKRRLDCDGGEGEEALSVKEKDPEKTFVTGVPLLSMPGHTGYLTFATLPAPRKSSVSEGSCSAKATD